MYFSFFSAPRVLLLGLLLLTGLPHYLKAQNNNSSKTANNKFTLSGRVQDSQNGEDLIGATIFDINSKQGVATNAYGFYSLTLEEGKHEIEVRYIGYNPIKKTIELKANTTLNFNLEETKLETKSVEITSEKAQPNQVKSAKMSAVKIDIAQIKKLPALFGEVDVIKNIQTLPGVVSAGEGTTGFFVRGGSADQNLILLDEAPVYNPSHLLGFFSTFNADALKSAELYKGGIPAEYGGRLSSILDVRTKDGNNKKFSGSGGIGLIASRLTLEGPIQKDKSSFIISGRRTYADLFLKLSSNEATRSNKLYFYDFNAKANFKLSEKDRLFVAGYIGRDVFGFRNQFGLNWGNITGTVRYNRIITEKLFSNTTVVASNFDYNLFVNQGINGFDWKSNLNEYSLKQDFSYFLAPGNQFKFGGSYTLRTFDPGTVSQGGDTNAILQPINLTKFNAQEVALYASNEIEVGSRWLFQYGLRVAGHSQIGRGTRYVYNGTPEAGRAIDTIKYNRALEPIKTYWGLEPRANIRYTLDEKSSLKASYNHMFQYVHLISNNLSPLPTQTWLPSTHLIKPQQADQVALGYFRNFNDDMFEFSTEVFYKWFTNVTDFKDNANLILNEEIESQVRQGKGNAYGAEFFLRKKEGKLNGWLSYTWMRAQRTIPGVNEGREYFADYDRRNTINAVANYEINNRFQVGGIFTYGTGRPMSLPSGTFNAGGVSVPVFSERNGYLQPDFHRLDLSLNYIPNKNIGRKYQSTWNLTLYNVYSRKNPFSVYTRDKENPDGTFNRNEKEVVMLWLFGIIPTVTWNFNF